MKAQCNYIPETTWIRELTNGVRHITLRKGFVEKQIQHEENVEIQYEYDETNIYIVDRDNIEEYIQNNFDILFEQGLINENKPKEPSVEDRISSMENVLLNLL